LYARKKSISYWYYRPRWILSCRISFQDLVAEMVKSDLKEAKKDKLCVEKGFDIYNYYE
jgi:hypothetical protein